MAPTALYPNYRRRGRNIHASGCTSLQFIRRSQVKQDFSQPSGRQLLGRLPRVVYPAASVTPVFLPPYIEHFARNVCSLLERPCTACQQARPPPSSPACSTVKNSSGGSRSPKRHSSTRNQSLLQTAFNSHHDLTQILAVNEYDCQSASVNGVLEVSCNTKCGPSIFIQGV